MQAILSTLTVSHALTAILLRLSEHGPVEARKLLASQWGFLSPGEYSRAIDAIDAIEALS